MTAPTITALPTPPSRQDPDNFSDRTDAFLGALPTLVNQTNTLGTFVNTKANEADADAAASSASADAAELAKNIAQAAANFKGDYNAGTTYQVGQSVAFEGKIFAAKTINTGIDPVDGVNWLDISVVNEISDFGITATTAELNTLDGITATTAELNFNDITTLGTSEASKVVTADANGDVNLSEELKAKSYNETVVALTGTTPAVNCEAGNVFTLTTSGNTTFTFTNPPASGTAYAFTLRVKAGGTHTLTYPASVDFAEGTAPDAPASGETDVLVFFTTDGGTTFFGFQAGDALA